LTDQAVSLTRRKTLWAAALAALLAIIASWTLLPQRWRGSIPNSGQRFTSLAVLPLQNLSRDGADEYFTDGMTDVLIADLAQISSLRVISRTSVMQLKKTRTSPAELGRQLKVGVVVEGSVLRSGDRVRITADLVDTSTERHLWAKNYNRKI